MSLKLLLLLQLNSLCKNQNLNSIIVNVPRQYKWVKTLKIFKH